MVHVKEHGRESDFQGRTSSPHRADPDLAPAQQEPAHGIRTLDGFRRALEGGI